MREMVFSFFFQLIPFGIVYHFLKRKWVADFEARVGPKEAGISGLVQEFADLIKLFQKRSIETSFSEVMMMGLWFSMCFSLLGIVPLHGQSFIVLSEMGILLPVALAYSINFFFLVWSISRRDLQIHLAGFRVLTQSLSSSVLAIASLFFLMIQSGTLAWTDMAQSQSHGILSWNIFAYPPLGFLSFIFFVIAGMLMSFQSPFDLPFKSPEFSSGMFERSSGIFHVILRAGRFLLTLFWSIATVHVYLGSWHLFSGVQTNSGYLDSLVVLGKTLLLLFSVHWIQRVLPKLRVDQTTDLIWRIFIPFVMVGAMVFMMIKGLS